LNLNTSPTASDLAAILSTANDDGDHHSLWVDTNGDVHLAQLGSLNPVGLEESTPTMRMRFETFSRGAGYVGPAAAADTKWVGQLYAGLVKEWPVALKLTGSKVHYVDQY
jgi:hypothetical protein